MFNLSRVGWVRAITQVNKIMAIIYLKLLKGGAFKMIIAPIFMFIFNMIALLIERCYTYVMNCMNIYCFIFMGTMHYTIN